MTTINQNSLSNPKKQPGFFRVLFELTKIRLVALVLLSTAVGYYLAIRGPLDWPHFIHVLSGTGLVAAGSLALNQWMERRFDALMKRTMRRPIPAGHIRPSQALAVGMLLSALGLAYLFWAASWLAAVLAAVTLASYLLLYTPLKRKTSFNTLIGALPGAIPPMIGWSAVRGQLSFEAWVLFSILFLWQLPHFLAIAWLYRDEYRDAGFVMLSVDDAGGSRVARQAAISSAMLLPVSLFPSIFGMAGMLYFVTALVLGISFLGISLSGLADIGKRARALFVMSILYLSVLLIVMVADKA